VISAITHIARLARAGFVFAREGVFGVVDPSLVPPPGQLGLRIARLVDVSPGEQVLVLGAAGGMGILLVQLLRARGARVIGAARGNRVA